MGFLGKIEKWFEDKKESVEYKGNPLKKRRKNISIQTSICPFCRHDKAWHKNNTYKCTKCGQRYNL